MLDSQLTAALPPPSRVRWPLRTKLAAMGAALAVIPLLGLGALLIDINATTLETMAREFQLAVADDTARTLEAEFVEAQNGLDSIGRTLLDPDLGEDTTLTIAKTLLAANELLDLAAIYDEGGALVDVLREPAAAEFQLPQALDAGLRERAARLNAAAGNAVRSTTGPRIWLVVSLRSAGQVRGFAATLLSLKPLQHRVERLDELRFQGVADALFVVDAAKRIIAHPNIEVSDTLSSAATHSMLRTIELGAHAGRLYQAGEFESADGQAMVGSLVGMEGRPLGIVVQVPQRIAYASLRTMRFAVGAAVALVCLLVVLLSFVMARRVTDPIKKLTHFARELAARRFDSVVEVGTQDELALLASAMTGAAKDLSKSETQLRREVAIRTALGRYLPNELVERVVSREQDMALGGTRREVSVLFADVVAFTPLAEQMDAERTVRILNELFTVLTEIVFRHGGTVDKFIGDCVMAIWGAPKADGDHATHAIAAAEDMLSWLESGNAIWQERDGVTLRLAIGINTGEAVIGNVGSETRMQYTAIGDAVNVAARLESIARPQQILISAATKAAAGDYFGYIDLGEKPISGREHAVHVYEVRP